MTVSVVVPWRPGCPWREAAWSWVQDRYRAVHPSWELVEAGCADGPFNRAEAILEGVSRASGDVLVVADADVWCDPRPAVDQVLRNGWAIPHDRIHRLSPESTDHVLHGVAWRGLPLSTDNEQDSRPYRGHETGTLVVLTRDLLHEVPPDRRFVGWGHEDDAWAAALNTLAGRPWRGEDDLVHLWHPAQPRLERALGNPESFALWQRYLDARYKPGEMRALLQEVEPWPSRWSSTAPASASS